ncbi:MAG: MFS transporter [Bryobacterales bacterium]|nr:MFS transporter [Bryobacterales bacterium]
MIKSLLRPEWLLIGYLWICYMLNHADRQVVYTLFPALQKEFGFSDAVLGLTGSLFLWVYGLGSPIAGIMGDRWSKAKIVVGSLAVWSAFTVLSGVSPTGWFLLVCRGLLGISECLFMPAAYALMANAHPPETRSKAIAIFATSQLIGVAAGGSISGYVAENLSWRASFWMLGALGLLFALPLWRFLSRVPPSFVTAGKGETAELSNPPLVINFRTFLVHVGFAAAAAVISSLAFGARGGLVFIPLIAAICHRHGIASAAIAPFSSFLSLFSWRALRTVTTFVAIATFGLFLVYSWLPTFLYDKFSLGMARASFEASVYPQIGTALGLLVGGTIADRLYARGVKSARFWVVFIACIAAAPCIVLIGQAASLGTTRLAAMGFGFFSGFIAGNQAAAAFDVVPAYLRASTVGVLNLLGASVSGFGPLLGGLARRTIGVDRIMGFTGILYLVAAIVVLYGIRKHFARDYCKALENPDAKAASAR